MNDKIIDIGAVCGRFQIFHNDHLRYVMAAKARCRHLIVGITSPDPSLSPAEKTDLQRGRDAANPCTYYERMKMIGSALLEAGLCYDDFDIVPFPIGRPELIKYYIPDNATVFVTILDRWGHEKAERLGSYCGGVEVLWEKSDKLISSTMIRKNIISGDDWQSYVPKATYRFITDNRIDQRIKELGE